MYETQLKITITLILTHKDAGMDKVWKRWASRGASLPGKTGKIIEDIITVTVRWCNWDVKRKRRRKKKMEGKNFSKKRKIKEKKERVTFWCSTPERAAIRHITSDQRCKEWPRNLFQEHWTLLHVLSYPFFLLHLFTTRLIWSSKQD